MNYSRFLAILAIFFIFQNILPGNEDSNIASVTPLQAPAPVVTHGGNYSPVYSVSIIKKLFNGTPLSAEEKRFPKIALGLTCAINALFIPLRLKEQGLVSAGDIAVLNIVALPVTWFFSEFLNGEWDD